MLRRDTDLRLASDQLLSVDDFAAAHRRACEDIASGLLGVVPQGIAREALRSDEQLWQTQLSDQYTWTGFFDEYLPVMFKKFSEDDELWRQETNIALSEIPKRKRAKLESMQSRDRVAKATKCAAYLAIASFAHDDDPLDS